MMLKGLDYTVWFVYAKLDGYERITYVIERIGKNGSEHAGMALSGSLEPR